MTAVRLDSFKSFRHQTLPLSDLTLLVGRNGSGKSNALDGLHALGRIATGAELRDALDGTAVIEGIRGGAGGCAPIGANTFRLGCEVRGTREMLEYSITVQVDPVVRVLEERLETPYRSGPHRGSPRSILATDPSEPDSYDLTGRWANRKQGRNPPVRFNAGTSILSQAASRVPVTSEAGREVIRQSGEVLAALRGVFILDPVPHRMRGYVRENDTRLRRNAENSSAAVGALLGSEPARARLLDLLQHLYEPTVVDVGTVRTELDDVMFYVVEVLQGVETRVPAQLMSDGSLRFIAILTALLGGELDVATTSAASGEPITSSPTIVIEELENGLHPSQAETVVELIRQVTNDTGLATLATAHSPAVLDAVPGVKHDSVIVCYRDGAGYSVLTPATELDDYVDFIASGRLGAAATRDLLRRREQPRGTGGVDDFLSRLGA